MGCGVWLQGQGTSAPGDAGGPFPGTSLAWLLGHPGELTASCWRDWTYLAAETGMEGTDHPVLSLQGPTGYKGMVGTIGAAGRPVSALLYPRGLWGWWSTLHFTAQPHLSPL